MKDYGILMTPGLLIKDEVKSIGIIPNYLQKLELLTLVE